jgi:glycosyltransferase involved in cell wall biosynthesis
MRLLFLNPIGNVGGAERVLLAAVAGAKREMPGAVVRVLMLSDGPLGAAARELGAEVEVLPLPAGLGELGDSHSRGAALAWRSVARLPALASFVGRLRAAIARFTPDLVHSNGIKTHLLSRLAVPGRVPMVWHVHDFYGSRPAAGWLLRRSRSRVRAAVAVSQAVAVDARRVLPGVHVEVVPNAVDLERFAPSPGDGEDLDRRAGLPPALPGTVRVGLVATYARWKGHLAVLDAAAKLAREAPALPVRWYLVGGPIYHTAAQFTEPELRAAVESRGLAGRVAFVPFASDPVPVYRALDVVLHASTQPEPFGLTVVEAMACGRAVVVSAAGGAAELFTDDRDALGVPPGDVDRLAAAVRGLVDNPELRVRLGAAARCTAIERFDANHYGPRLCRVYREIVARAAR